ncbi:MAG: hypothetical protein QMB54_08030 [Neofamilia sp.]
MRRWENQNFAKDERGTNRKIAGLVMAKIILDYDIDSDKILEYLRYYDGLVDMMEGGECKWE